MKENITVVDSQSREDIVSSEASLTPTVVPSFNIPTVSTVHGREGKS